MTSRIFQPKLVFEFKNRFSVFEVNPIAKGPAKMATKKMIATSTAKDSIFTFPSRYEELQT